jgi:hypothetical protein
MNHPLLFVGLGLPELILVFLFAALPILLTVIALVDILRHDFRQPNDKLIWVLVVLFLPVLGFVLYFTIGRKQRLLSQ